MTPNLNIKTTRLTFVIDVALLFNASSVSADIWHSPGIEINNYYIPEISHYERVCMISRITFHP